MEISVKAQALVTLVIVFSGIIFSSGYAYGRSGLELNDLSLPRFECSKLTSLEGNSPQE